MRVEVMRMSGVYTNPHHVMAYDDGEVRQQSSPCFIARPLAGTLTATSEPVKSPSFLWAG